MKKFLKGVKGFTLVELCIVIAITAIVGTMVASFIVIYKKQSNVVVQNTSVMNDITSLRTSLNEWVNCYDSKDDSIAVSGNDIVADNKSGTQDRLNLTATGDNCQLTWMKSGSEFKKFTYSSLSKVEFKIIKGTNSAVLTCTATYKFNNKTTTQIITCSIFSASVRSRYVD